MLGLICLIIGIVGLVKRRVSVSKTKELRGGPLYLVCTLFILPLPLSLLAGVLIGVTSSGNQAQMERLVNIFGVLCGILPLIVGIVLAFVLAKPKTELTATGPRGFEVQPPK